VLAVLSMQFLSSGLNMLQVSNFARELIWGALLIFVMVVNTMDWSRFRTLNPINKPVSKGGRVT
jgi:ribose/xylose/arabinose/galactoside ABC-type transport system permease subunit